MPVANLKRNSRYLPNHLGFLRMLHYPHGNRGERVGLQNDVIAFYCAPGTDVAITSLYKVDGTFVFRTPHTLSDFVSGFIYLKKSARRQERIHRKVFRADVAVGVVIIREVSQISEGDYSPLLNHAAKVGSSFEVERGIEPHRYMQRGGCLQGLRKM